MSDNNLFQNTTPSNNSFQQQRYLHVRKNACVVCSICFTCSKYYGINCNCQEIQPRRGKNLPRGGLDSRAKKLHRQDATDYQFSIRWINENAHQMYKDENDCVIGLRELSEVSLCKAHSSTLYRAKKRHEKLVPPTVAGGGGLAAKVKEIATIKYQQPTVRTAEMPDFTKLSHSISNKRKRTIIQSPQMMATNSISTPLLYGSSRHTSVSPSTSYSTKTSTKYVQQHQAPPPPPPPIPSQAYQQQQQQHVFSSSSHLPPLHTRKVYNTPTTPIPSNKTVIETVSLKSSENHSMYYFRNLAITDTFTFRDLLQEIDMTGSVPTGKRLVISDQDKFYPLDQAIRSVIPSPTSTHLELCLGLTDKPLINWTHY